MSMAKPALRNERVITCGQAIREGLLQAMRRDPSVFLMGEGIQDPASMFGTTAGIDGWYRQGARRRPHG
jgi:acetoin:2,6-dichlorophenolindophenol oxidoreductase subunit beta